MGESVNEWTIGRTWFHRIQSRGSVTNLPGLIREGFPEEMEAALPWRGPGGQESSAETGWGVGNTVSKGGKVCVCVAGGAGGQGQLGFAIKYLSSTFFM